MITADQLLAHAVGDYVLQSDWMAINKTRSTVAALAHALFYSLPFLFLSPTVKGMLIIALSHFVIDRWRLARYVCSLRNCLAPLPQRTWAECNEYASAGDRPPWITTWLLIIVDNTIHVWINGWALGL
jgi:Protein of unknown function (DUF3307)